MTDSYADPAPGSRAPADRRVATVDIGTNSIRLLVAVAHPDGSYRLLDDEKVVARLGRGMATSNVLSEEAMEEAALAVTRMKAIAEGYEVEMLRAVATCAVREAENRDAFLAKVRETAGIDVEVISGEEEARLAYESVRCAFDLRGRDVAVVDIGGGSTEVVLAGDGIVEQLISLPLGAVRLTEELADAPADVPVEKVLRDRVRRALKKHLKRPDATPKLIIGTGGTFTTLASMDLLLRRERSGDDGSPVSVRGHELHRADVRRWLARLAAMPVRDRASIPGLSPDRAEIIVAGLTIIERIMKRLSVNTLQVHDRGIRDGLLLSMTHELFPDTAPSAKRPIDRLEAARRFARACRYEAAHSEHVTALALEIYDQLCGQLPDLPASVRDGVARELLETAGVLHDVGYFINYARHHKHAYHLILHSELAGYRHRELEIVANIARYHRRALPKPAHTEYAVLEPDEQEMVRYLAAILRLADGLDRAHAGRVQHVNVEVDTAKLTAWFTVYADEEPEVDLWGAARKSQLFTRTFGLEPRLHFAPASERPAGRNGAE